MIQSLFLVRRWSGDEKWKGETLFKAVLFDFDGTLGDTIPVGMASLHQTLEPILQRKVTDEEIYATFGPSEEATIRVILENDGFVTFDSNGNETDLFRGAVQEYLRLYEILHRTLSPNPFDGIPLLLDDLKKAGTRIALVTGKGAISCGISIRQYQMEETFEHIETGTPTGLFKEDGILRSLEAFGISPDDACYVGDMPTDVAGAHKAGVGTYVVAWATIASREQLLATSPLALCDSVDELRRYLFS